MNSKDRSSSGSQWLNWLATKLPKQPCEPENKEQLVEVLRQAKSRALFDTDALAMIEGVLQVSDLRVRDIMIPRAQMCIVRRDEPLENVVKLVVESAHSRLPVIDDDKAEVVGILLAKDLLQYCGDSTQKFQMRDILRSTVFVPESKRLNVLLKDFRASRNHMAIVVDEYGAAAGLVTIEDVLEQIVGEIEDEYDFDEGAYIMKHSASEYTVKAHTEIEDFNEAFETEFLDEEYDTIGGMVIKAFGHVPQRGESVDIEQFRFTILRADSRTVRLLNVEVIAKDE